MNQETNTRTTAKKVWNTPRIDVIQLDITDIIATSTQGSTQQYNWEEQSDIWVD